MAPSENACGSNIKLVALAPDKIKDAAAEFQPGVQIVSPPPDQILNSKFGADDARGVKFGPGGHRQDTEPRKDGQERHS